MIRESYAVVALRVMSHSESSGAGVGEQRPWAKPGLPSASANPAPWEHRYAHICASFSRCSCTQCGVRSCHGDLMAHKTKILTMWSFTEKVANPSLLWNNGVDLLRALSAHPHCVWLVGLGMSFPPALFSLRGSAIAQGDELSHGWTVTTRV